MKNFKNKKLLITGGTGSFGNTMLNLFLETDIAEIRIFSRDEKKQEDMRQTFRNKKVKFFIGDVRNKDSLREAVSNVDYIFHAAALKQVPSCETFPLEAVQTNVLGTENVLNAAIEAKVKKVICLSTDKAVYPINAMGMSKALMEKIAIAKARTTDKTVICVTRYGNVIGSRGSVVPLFIEQIKNNKDIEVTEPEMTRFLMSLSEAAKLVLFAFEYAKQGDILVQKSPATTVEILAEALKKMYFANNKIKIIGTRKGEKVHETLLTREERARVIEYDKYFVVPPYQDNQKGDKLINNAVEYTSFNTERLNLNQTIEKLKAIL